MRFFSGILALAASTALLGCPSSLACRLAALESGDAEPRSAEGGVVQTVTTEPSFRFLVVGDTGTGDLGQWAVGKAMTDRCRLDDRPACRFVLMLGDNFYESGLDPLSSAARKRTWRERFLLPYEGLRLPFYAVLGNHDFGWAGLGWDASGASARRAELQIEGAEDAPPCDTAEGPGWCMKGLSYSFKYGFGESDHATFVALDTTSAFVGRRHLAQQETVAATLRDEGDAGGDGIPRWVFVFGHHSYRSSGSHGAVEPRTRVGALYDLAADHADLIMTGHDHHLEFFLPVGGERAAFVVSGSGGRRRAVKRRHAEGSTDLSENYGFFEVIVSRDHLQVQPIEVLPLEAVAREGGGAPICQEVEPRVRERRAWCRKRSHKLWNDGPCDPKVFR